MKPFLSAALLLSTALLSASGVNAQTYNPFGRQYRSWNNSFPGYSSGGSIYREQVRSMNPYGEVYRSFNQQRRDDLRWLGR